MDRPCWQTDAESSVVTNADSHVVTDAETEYRFSDCDGYTLYASVVAAVVLFPLAIVATLFDYGDYNSEASLLLLNLSISLLSS